MTARFVTPALDHIRQLLGAHQSQGLTDGLLLDRYVRDRDEAAFASLVQRHGPMVLRVGRRVLVREHDAEDVFQATFLVLARKAASIARGESVSSWLYGVAYHLARNLQRGAARQQARHEKVEVPPADSPPVVAAWHEIQTILDEELKRLPAKYRTPLILCYLEGLSHDDAARQLGWPIGTVKGRLARGRDLLREGLTQRGLALSAGAFVTLMAANTAQGALPVTLFAATLTGAMRFAGAEELVGAVSANVIRIAEEGLKTLFRTKIKSLVGALLALSLTAGGAGVLAFQGVSVEPGEEKRAAETHQGESSVASPKNDAKDRVRIDVHGNPLPDGALARFGSNHYRPAYDSEHVIAFSRDLKTVVWADHANLIRMDLDSGKHLNKWAGNRHADSAFAFHWIALSLDGKFLAAVEHGTNSIRVWDLAAGTEVGKIKSPLDTFGIRGLALAPDGQSLATSITGVDDSTTIYILELSSGKELRKIATTQGMIDTLAYSPDGKVLLSWGHGNGFSHVTGWDKSYPIILFDCATGKELRKLDSGKGVTHVAFSPDSQTLFWSELELKKEEAGQTRVVAMATGKERMAALRGPAGPLALSPDGKIVLARTHSGQGLGQWDAETGKLCSVLKAKGWVAAFAADGQTLAAAGQSEIRRWATATGKEQLCRQYGGHLKPVEGLAFVPDGKALISWGCASAEILIWDVATTHEHPLLQGEENGLNSVHISADGKTLMVQRDRKLSFVDPATGKEFRTLEIPTQVGGRVALSPDGKQLAWTHLVRNQNPAIHLWEVVTGKELRTFTATGVMSMAFSKDGKVLAAGMEPKPDEAGNSRGWSNQICLWDVGTGKELGHLGDAQENAHIDTIAFSPDGRNLVSQQGTGLRLWELATCQRRCELPGRHFACSPDSRFLATLPGGLDPVISVWDLYSGRECQQFKTQRGVRSIAFSPDGKSLAAGGAETSILLWDVSRCIQPLPAPDLSSKAAEAMWADLASTNGRKAYQAVMTLAAAPKPALAVLRERLRPIGPTVAAVSRLVADLDSSRFEVRRKATDELEKLQDQAEPALRDALVNGRPSLELRRRLEQLLEKLEGQSLSPQMAQIVRAVEVLELLGSAEAHQLLETLAGGESQARQTREARAALQRLSR